jgi:hypothetical protein
MNQVENVSLLERSLWERLLQAFALRPEGDMGYQVPADSLFANTWNGGTESVADVPEAVKAQIREEALLTAFNRLETSLRLLLYATTPGKEPPTPEHLHQILNVWRFELEHRVNLVPDTYCGAVQNYAPEMDAAYTIDGRCSSGDRLRIRVPCWRMFEKIVIRGEAEVLPEDWQPEPGQEPIAAAAAAAADADAEANAWTLLREASTTAEAASE